MMTAKRKLTLLFTLLFVIIVTGGCRKEAEKIPDEDDEIVVDYDDAIVVDHRLTNVHYYSSNEGILSTSYEEREYLYDETGNLVKISYYYGGSSNVNDNPNERFLYTYKILEYSGNRLIMVTMVDQWDDRTISNYLYEDDNLVKIEHSYVYEDDIFKIKIEHSDGSDNYEYEDDNLVRMYSLDEDGKISGVTEFFYDDKNQLIHVSCELPIKYEYDDNGRRIKTEYYNINKELVYYIESNYEGENKLPSRKLPYDNKGNVVDRVKFDKWCNLVESKTVDGCLIFQKRYEGELLLERIVSQDIYFDLSGKCSDDFALVTKYTYANIKTNMFKNKFVFWSIFFGTLLDLYNEESQIY